MTVLARVRKDDAWSALHEMNIIVPDYLSPLRITDLHYHPLDGNGINDGEYAFIELKNLGGDVLNLSESSFVDGIDYKFPTISIIQPHDFLVLASNTPEFNQRYGFPPDREYLG